MSFLGLETKIRSKFLYLNVRTALNLPLPKMSTLHAYSRLRIRVPIRLTPQRNPSPQL